MNKTNPIGVRFRLDILEKLKKDHKIESPQKALVFLERFYVSHHSVLKEVSAPLRTEKVKDTHQAKEKPKKAFNEKEDHSEKESKRELTPIEKIRLKKLGLLVCQNIHKNGIIVENELHANYLADMEAEFTIDGHPLKYFDTKEEALEFEQNNKPLQD